MSAIAVIRRLQESSGRYDLLTADWFYYLNMACRTLFSRASSKQKVGRSLTPLAACDDRIVVIDLRALEEVWLHTTNGRIKADLSLRSLGQIRGAQAVWDIPTLLQLELGISPSLATAGGRIFCVEVMNLVSQSMSDKTVVSRVNLTNSAALTIAAQPLVPTELMILIEDGLLTPLNPSRDITAGTVTITGTDKDDAALIEAVDCSAGAGEYITTGRFKTITTVATTSFNYLTTGDEKITVLSSRMSFARDLDIAKAYRSTTLVFWPTLEEKATVECIGKFYPETLSADADTNFWTEEYSDALYAQVAKMLEIPLRNREGLLDWDRAIEQGIFEVTANEIKRQEASSRNTGIA